MTFLGQSHRDTKLVATGKEGRNHRGLSTLVTFCALPILHTGGCRHRLWAPQSSVLWNADLIGSSWALASWQAATEFSALFLHVIALLSSQLLLTCSYCILNIKHALICWQAWIHRLAPQAVLPDQPPSTSAVHPNSESHHPLHFAAQFCSMILSSSITNYCISPALFSLWCHSL